MLLRHDDGREPQWERPTVTALSPKFEHGSENGSEYDDASEPEGDALPIDDIDDEMYTEQWVHNTLEQVYAGAHQPDGSISTVQTFCNLVGVSDSFE